MSTSKKKKPAPNSVIQGLKNSSVSNGKLSDTIKETVNRKEPELKIFQFISESLTVTGGNDLNLFGSKVIVFECEDTNAESAYEKFRNDIKNKLKIVSEADLGKVFHDMFGSAMTVVSIPKRSLEGIVRARRTNV